jgi:hypothetical protein
MLNPFFNHLDRWRGLVLALCWCLLVFQGTSPSAWAQSPEEDGAVSESNPARVILKSDPTGQPIMVDEKTIQEVTPTTLELNPGTHVLMVNAEGYQPLTHEILLSAAEEVELEFILLRTPPEPPSKEELRMLSPTGEISGENVAAWRAMENRETQKARMANNSCLDCHLDLTRMQFNGGHKPLVCETCHGDEPDHAKDGKYFAPLSVIRGDGIQGLCLGCHDRDNRSATWSHARTVAFPGHLDDLDVGHHNKCDDCHHVHDPNKWVYEAREMVGLPTLLVMQPMMNEDIANQRRQSFIGLTEVFLVFPTIPGAMGLMTQTDNDEFPSDILFLSGIALMGLSYLAGKYVQSRDLKSIQGVNEEIRASNDRKKTHNELVKKAMADYNQAISEWGEEAVDRGMVKVGAVRN